jgi:pyocin large subunit-like protein
MRPQRPVAVQSAAALIVIVLAVLAQQFFRGTSNGRRPDAPPPTDNAPTQVAPPPPAQAARPNVGFRARGALDEHYRKHGREFGPDVTKDEYLRRAQALRDAPTGGPILETRRADGVTTRFDRRTGDFVAFNPDATLRTFFRPNDGEAYYKRQAQRDGD